MNDEAEDQVVIEYDGNWPRLVIIDFGEFKNVAPCNISTKTAESADFKYARRNQMSLRNDISSKPAEIQSGRMGQGV